MSELLDQQRKFWARCKTDFYFFCEKVLRIRTLADARGNLVYVRDDDEDKVLQDIQWRWVPFQPNAIQRKVVQEILRQEAAGKPQRLWILKSRKEGCSTVIQALFFWRACFHSSYEILTFAHLAKPASKIAAISRGYAQKMPAVLAPYLAPRCSGEALYWRNGSKLEVFTARSDDSARSGSPSAGHLSEAAFYSEHRQTTSAEAMLQATLAAFDMVPGTCVVGESTSAGPGGPFYRRFRTAVEAKSSDWSAMFFGWQDSEKYDFRFTKEQEVQDANMKMAYNRGDIRSARHYAIELGYDEIWFQRAVDLNLTPGQVHWAMRMVQDHAGGDLVRFDREYPVSWQVAFSGASRTVFPEKLRAEWRDKELPEGSYSGRSFEDDEGKIVFDTTGDRWLIFEESDAERSYVLGADVGAGVEGDYSTICVLDRVSGRQVAEYRSHTVPPDEFALQVVRAARYYNNAFIIHENNNYGHVVTKVLLELGYPYLYRRNPDKEVKAGEAWTEQFGFRTGRNKSRVVDLLKADCVAGRIQPQSPRFFAETETYMYTAKEEPTHMAGEHDDCIMAMVLAAEAHRILPSADRDKVSSEAFKNDRQERIAKFKERIALKKTRAGYYA